VEQFALEFDLTPQRRVYSVSELNAAIRGMLDEEFRDIWVSGEISGLKLAASGHYYFTLKERDAQLKCVAFRSSHRYWKFKPPTVWPCWRAAASTSMKCAANTSCSWNCWSRKASARCNWPFEQLKKKLAAEGLFATERKRALPRFPRRIGIVTSPRGAAIADMVGILSRRFPGITSACFRRWCKALARWRKSAAASSISAAADGRRW
jgi:exodeoxyribonuclease VII large subunit